jgi:hypothetical protein
MWKTLFGLFGGSGDGEAAKPRARKPRKGQAKKASARRVKDAAGATLKAAAGPSRARKVAAKRRGSRKPKFVWPTEPQKVTRRASKPVVTDGQQGDDPNWSQKTQPLL